MRELLCMRQRELADIDAEIDAFTGTGQCQRDSTLGEYLGGSGFDNPGMRFGLRVVAEHFRDVVDIGKAPGTVIYV